MLTLLFCCRESPVSLLLPFPGALQTYPHLPSALARTPQSRRKGEFPSPILYMTSKFTTSLTTQSLTNLAWFRKLPIDDPRVGEEFTEILATVKEERESKGALQECLRRGHRIRFVIAFTMFTLQQWSGQVNSWQLLMIMGSHFF